MTKKFNRDFTYHQPTDEDVVCYEKIRNSGREFAMLLNALCPEGKELDKAFEKVEEAIFWSIASIARDGK